MEPEGGLVELEEAVVELVFLVREETGMLVPGPWVPQSQIMHLTVGYSTNLDADVKVEISLNRVLFEIRLSGKSYRHYQTQKQFRPFKCACRGMSRVPVGQTVATRRTTSLTQLQSTIPWSRGVVEIIPQVNEVSAGGRFRIVEIMSM